MNRFLYMVVFCFVAVSLSACMARQAIDYPMDDIPQTSNSMFEKAVLAVKSFEDGRETLASCSGKNVAKIERGDRSFYYNCDRHYESDSITREITKTTVDHLKHAHIFKNVILVDNSSSSNADYLLSGKVTKFDGLVEYRPGAAVAERFGPVGDIINRFMKGDYEATTIFEDLYLTRVRDNAVIWKGKVIGHIEGSDEVDPEGWSSYSKANLSLKEANSNLVNLLKKLGATPPGNKDNLFTFEP